MHRLELTLEDESATERFGQCLSAILPIPATVYLAGDLGVGKTRLVRAILQSMGHQGNVKSPTYTLVEPYAIGDISIHHFDLYRLADPEELEFLGIRDYFNDQVINFVEWPDKGRGFIAEPDLLITLRYAEQPDAREVTIECVDESVYVKLSDALQDKV